MGQIEFTLNGELATAEEGMTILKAAEVNGIEVPHLCHADYLEPWGACRLCVVEVEGQRALMPSCYVNIQPGMKVSTHSERVLGARKLVLELLLSAHPKDCLTCEMSGKCLLQKYCYEMGIENSRFEGGQVYNYLVHRDNPFYIRDYNKCILCGKCVRACAEVQGDNIIDFAHRGFDTIISTALERTMAEADCVFCGNCVAACPTGALVEKDTIGAAREWEVEKVTTTCPYCGCGCQFDLNIRDDKVVKVTSNENAPVNGVALCVKGRFGYGFVNSAGRLTTPLIRKYGELKPAGWNEALDLVAKRLNDIRTEHGTDSIGGLSSAKCTNEENYLFQKFMRAVIGTNSVDHCARL